MIKKEITILTKIPPIPILSDWEKYIKDSNYLEKLTDSYAKFFYYYDDAPLLVVNAESIDPIHNDEHFKMLYEEVVSVKYGKHFFNSVATVLP